VKSFFVAFLGALIAIIVLVLLVGSIGGYMAGKQSAIEDRSWLIVEMYGDLLEYDPPGGIMSQLVDSDVETLQRILDNLEKAAVDDRIEGVIFKVAAGNSVGTAMLQEIRGAIRRVQDTGKRVLAWAESFDRQDYLLLAACNEVLVPPTAYIGFTGFSSETLHVKRAFDKLGIEPNIHKIKEYKSAAETADATRLFHGRRSTGQWSDRPHSLLGRAGNGAQGCRCG